MAWVIMPRFGQNLENYFEKMKNQMSSASALDVGLAMITSLEATHKAGYIFNDLKLDNLMVGYGQKIDKTVNEKSVFTGCSIHLVDFGFATKYKDK
jgi:serine/threonine protein kinase